MQVRQSASLIPFHRLQISSPISRLSVEFQSGITSHFLFGVSRQLAWSRSKIRAMMELVLSVRLLLDMFQANFDIGLKKKGIYSSRRSGAGECVLLPYDVVRPEGWWRHAVPADSRIIKSNGNATERQQSSFIPPVISDVHNLLIPPNSLQTSILPPSSLLFLHLPFARN